MWAVPTIIRIVTTITTIIAITITTAIIMAITGTDVVRRFSKKPASAGFLLCRPLSIRRRIA
jgi:hypothetical protein